jgi:hypothetical protein
MPTVILCTCGLYAFIIRKSAGAVADERCVRWAEVVDREGGGRVSEVPEPGLVVGALDEVDLVQHEDELLSVGLLPPAYLFFNETATTSVWVMGVEDEDDEVRLVNEFVQVPNEVFSCMVQVWIRVARQCWCW